MTGLVLSPTGVAGAAAGVAVGFGVGNTTSNLIGDGWDYIIGPDIKFLQNLEGTKERILSTGSLKNVLLHHWTNSNPTMSIKDIVNKIGPYELKLTGSTPLEMMYVKDDDKCTFSSGGTQENFETLLKYLDAGDTPFFKVHNNEEFQLERNYLNDFGHNYPDFSDQLGRYALLALRPYITTLDKDFYTAVPSADNFSAKFIADRKALYEDAFIFEEKFGGQLDEFTSQYIDLKYGIETDWGVFKNVIGFGGGGGSVLEGTMLDDNLYGRAGVDKLYGEDGNDYLWGESGNDKLYGEEGDDFLSGGSGNDTLEGSLGNDTYFFSKGDGQDVIIDANETSFFWFNKENAGNDTIKFAEDVKVEDISFTMSYGDLFLQYGENDIVKVKNQDNSKEQIERIELSDGNYLTNDDIDLVIQQINSYGQDNGMWNVSNSDIQGNVDLMNIVSAAWSK